MQHAAASAGLGLFVLGILAVSAGLGLLVFRQDDQPTTDDGGVFEDPQPSGDNAPEARVGQMVAVVGGLAAVVGLVLVVVGRSD